MVNAVWAIPNTLVRSRSDGQTGYTFLVDNKGFLASHPKYGFVQQVNLTDAKFGKLATIARDQMSTGQAGCVR